MSSPALASSGYSISSPVVVNGRFASRPLTGVERYASEVLRCMSGALRIIRPPARFQGMPGHAWEQFILPTCLRKREILWSPANTGPLFVSNQVLSLYDLDPLTHPEWFRPAFAAWYRLLLPSLLRQVRQVIVPSEWVRFQMAARFPRLAAKVTVAPAGVDTHRFRPVDPAPARLHYRLPPLYILYVGSLAPRKNLPVLLRAWEMLHTAHPAAAAGAALVIAGAAGAAFPALSDFSPAPNGSIRWLGYVPDEILPSLYSGAVLCVIPSFQEGFGLPALEAMACGAPVLASHGGALPEVVEECGLLFDPHQPSALAGHIAHLLSDASLRQSLCQRGLQRAASSSWSDTARQVAAVLQAAAA